MTKGLQKMPMRMPQRGIYSQGRLNLSKSEICCVTGKGIYQILSSRLYDNLFSFEQPLLRVDESLSIRQPVFSWRYLLPCRFRGPKEDVMVN
jgi:hypothetical protein